MHVPMQPTESLKYGTMKHFVKLEKCITDKFPPNGLKRDLKTCNQPRVVKWASEWMLEFDLEPQLESDDEESPCMEDLESCDHRALRFSKFRPAQVLVSPARFCS
uniref:Uncharacterized protein n=1 Tax=Coccolithus braarudii TaxID=221442 RepID=A0A7S0LW53_9EUKA|mmetsp:Transcript_9255/g.20187  ORF Transcript_9255/g.20187 Transcript_9255/m.20187 type:complete len:105 (+) Transcript_9255:1166-1480(+)